MIADLPLDLNDGQRPMIALSIFASCSMREQLPDRPALRADGLMVRSDLRTEEVEHGADVAGPGFEGSQIAGQADRHIEFDFVHAAVNAGELIFEFLYLGLEVVGVGFNIVRPVQSLFASFAWWAGWPFESPRSDRPSLSEQKRRAGSNGCAQDANADEGKDEESARDHGAPHSARRDVGGQAVRAGIPQSVRSGLHSLVASTRVAACLGSSRGGSSQGC